MKTCFVFTSLDNDELHQFALSEIGRRYQIIGSLRSNRASQSVLSRVENSFEVDYIFNFLSPKVLPDSVLNMARICAINFHPGSYEYPGVGSASLSLFDRKEVFGVTSHIMNNSIDSGEIICERFFKIPSGSNSKTLFSLALKECRFLLLDTLNLLDNTPEPLKIRSWSRNAVTRLDFDKWLVLANYVSSNEIDLKIKSAVHPDFPGPYVKIGKHIFTYLQTEV